MQPRFNAHGHVVVLERILDLVYELGYFLRADMLMTIDEGLN